MGSVVRRGKGSDSARRPRVGGDETSRADSISCAPRLAKATSATSADSRNQHFNIQHSTFAISPLRMAGLEVSHG